MDVKKCRLCLEDDKRDTFRSLFETFGNEYNEKLCDKITSLTKIEIYPNDGLPGLICNKCMQNLTNCIEFITLCKQSDIWLRNSKTESDDELYLDNRDNNVQSKIEIKNEIDVVTDKSSKNPNKYQCSTCGKVMSSSFRLKTHLVTHTGERRFSCIQCGKKFSLAQNLNVHMRIHTGEKPYKCITCGTKFAHSSGLSAHKKIHSGEFPYSCTLCPRKFRTIGHLHYHVRRHTGQLNFECESCGRAFITRNDLKNHLLTHSITKPLVCSICGLRLSRPYNLKRHISLVHNGAKIPNNLKHEQLTDSPK